jgi:hypothetical protein
LHSVVEARDECSDNQRQISLCYYQSYRRGALKRQGVHGPDNVSPSVGAMHQRYLAPFDCAADGYLVTDSKGLIQVADRAAYA